jgi:hypothetical protein
MLTIPKRQSRQIMREKMNPILQDTMLRIMRCEIYIYTIKVWPELRTITPKYTLPTHADLSPSQAGSEESISCTNVPFVTRHLELTKS